MTDLVIAAVLAVVLAAAARYVYRAKKRGAKCIGCAGGEGGCCAHKHSEHQEASPCGCGCHMDSGSE